MAATEEIEKEILAEMAANPVPYAAGQVNDVITIDGETRMISVPASEIFFGVESDKDVERKHFRCPKVVGDGIDLSKHQIYISYITSDSAGKTFSGNAGLYLCEDVATDGDDITFSWQLSGNVFASAGFIAFKVLAAKTDGENVQTRWNTVPAIGTVLMTVPDGMDIGEAYPDIVTQLLERMASVEKIATEEAMQGYVNTYLEAHPGEIDETLTDPKKAAPASVVGELKEDINELDKGNSLPNIEWVLGNYKDGVLDSSITWRLSTKNILFAEEDLTYVINDSEYFILLSTYQSDGTFISSEPKNNTIKIQKGTYYTFTIYKPSSESYKDDASLYYRKVYTKSNIHKDIEQSVLAARKDINKLLFLIADVNLAYNAEFEIGNAINPQVYDTEINRSTITTCVSKIDLGVISYEKIRFGVLNKDYVYSYSLFDESKKFIGNISFKGEENITQSKKVRYVIIQLRKVDNSNIDLNKILNAGFYIILDNNKIRFTELQSSVTELQSSVTEKRLITLNYDNPDYSKVFDIEKYSYNILNITAMCGRDFEVSISVDGEYKKAKLINAETGEESYTAWHIGRYYVDKSYGCESIKVTSKNYYSNYMIVDLESYRFAPYISNNHVSRKYLTGFEVENTFGYSRVFGVYDDCAYYFNGNVISKINLNTYDTDVVYTADNPISSAMIFDNGNIILNCDTVWKMYLLKDGVLEEKHTFYDSEHNVNLMPNYLFSLYNYKNIGIASEYRPSKEPVSGYKAYITKDYGETWDVLFDLTKHVSDENNRIYHLHSVVYDPYGDMYWACNGDAPGVDMIHYSFDGITWYKINDRISIKATVIVPMRDCVLFLSDLNTVCVYKWARKAIMPGDKLYLDNVYMFVPNWENACPIGCTAYYDECSDLTYFGYDTDVNINSGYSGDCLKYSDVFVTDGYNVKLLYKEKSETSLWGVFGNRDRIVICSANNNKICKKL